MRIKSLVNCLVGTYRGNVVNFVKIELWLLHDSVVLWYGLVGQATC